ncbi:LLM class flavin-dependent oxidoreductase [Corticibacter populi]|uniref:LLM class flavin-dependent oxidoreductase n=1 Tax=Corticibacter populi TaxID=1550736 RepID=A0A3M6QP53_9BURK|nr:LLM class flavin-dependent oxidoreductase [Corticibacter populi]RMX04828.1 LLM class flavin-dependent oxidoreductase [Corticibacter populi]RZS33753.1 FMN-dependent oxidoreductase (nitrilotriacetate monooxygenase family) [Corticibacter populi]
MTTKTMSLALFLFPGQHLGAWRLPDAIPEVDVGIEHYVRAAKLAEEAKLDAIFFEDQAAVPRSNDIMKGDTYGAANPRSIHFDPMMLLPALAMATKHLGLAATSTASFNEPYNLARRFASIDFISNGRVGWNLVTSFNESEAQNFGLDAHLGHAERYERASEFIDVVTGLWDSWDEGAVIRDKESGVYFDVDKMHFLRHEGKFFKVRGPLTMGRSPQGRPVIFQAGSSEPGRELAARTADVVFTLQTDMAASRAFREDIRQRAARFGRDPDKIKVLPGITPIVGKTDEEAQAFRERMRDLIPEELAITHLMPHSGGLNFRDYDLDGPMPDLPETNAGKSHRDAIVNLARRENLSILQTARRFAEGSYMKMVGAPATIANTMQEWLENDACDGFLAVPTHFPQGVEDFTRLVVPELQQRGIFRKEYTGQHLRDHLGVEKYS